MIRLSQALQLLHSLVWGPATLILLLGTGIVLSVRTGFPQLRHIGAIFRHTAGTLFHRRDTGAQANFSPVQAVTTALAGTVGTGNVAGVAGAIAAGGPGAVFWMWVSAFFGMCTKFVEIALALRWREDRGGVCRGGPMYYIERGLGRQFRWLAVLFALFGGLASFGAGNLVQSSEVAGAASELFGIPPLATGVILAALVGTVLLGGTRSVGRVTELLVPLMAGIYILAGLAAVLLRLGARVFGLIFREAFSLRAVGGGVFGTAMARAMRLGLARGIFSNEAGLGSAPIAHAAAEGTEPCEQAMWGVFEVFVDTFVICTLTALVLLLGGVTQTPGPLSTAGGAAVAAFDAVLPGSFGVFALRLALLLFALSSIFGWSFYGARCWGYLFRDSRAAELLYQLLFLLTCIPGAIYGAQAWELADTLNGLMAFPNLIALLLLSGEAKKLTRDYFT